MNGQLTSGTLTPAYGRDYKSGRDARADFENGKDFILHVYGAERNGPCGVSDFAPGSRVTIRYKRQTAVVVHVVGSTVPAARTARDAETDVRCLGVFLPH